MRPSEPIRLCAPGERAAVLSLLASCGLPHDGLSDHWDATRLAVDPERPVRGAGSGTLEIHGEAGRLR